MKKLLIVSLIFATVLAFSSFAMAKPKKFTCPPTILATDTADPTEVCFDWDWGCRGTPVKYSVDVELLIAGEGWDDPLAETQGLSFGTSDRTDGEPMDATFLCVPIDAFVYWDGAVYADFYGDARAKVKALAPDSLYRQNNAFSAFDEFIIED
jgi:hypothetical protein